MLLRLAEDGDMRALQVDVGVSGWMCLLVVYNFSTTAGAIGKTAVSQAILHVECFNGYRTRAMLFSRHTMRT